MLPLSFKTLSMGIFEGSTEIVHLIKDVICNRPIVHYLNSLLENQAFLRVILTRSMYPSVEPFLLPQGNQEWFRSDLSWFPTWQNLMGTGETSSSTAFVVSQHYVDQDTMFQLYRSNTKSEESEK